MVAGNAADRENVVVQKAERGSARVSAGVAASAEALAENRVGCSYHAAPPARRDLDHMFILRSHHSRKYTTKLDTVFGNRTHRPGNRTHLECGA
ncbi:hypothetical protein GCM10010420_22860 [Streptomyces glaucosporus]|uniref:Uncharacterized protein n=1 Tax=Streptomyces glaucosporus TaxID=284044 RepID=A0ABN3I7A6_9ACTN